MISLKMFNALLSIARLYCLWVSGPTFHSMLLLHPVWHHDQESAKAGQAQRAAALDATFGMLEREEWAQAIQR